MEDFNETRPLDIGPIYFFDQMKPKRKIWEKRDHLPDLEHTSEDKLSPTESMHPKDKEARLSIVAAVKIKSGIRPFPILPTPVVFKFPTDFTFSRKHMLKSEFEECKHAAAELLYELGKTLQIYAENNIAFPVGIVHLVNYSWHDLIEESSKYATKKPMSKKQGVLKSNFNSMIVDKISNYPRIEGHKENYLMNAKKDHHHFVSIDTMEKTCWIFHYPYTKLEILKWKKVLDIAVKKLQEAIIQIKTEQAKLKKEGFNKQLILRHYNDPKDEARVDKRPFRSQHFWLQLLKGKPRMPKVQRDNPGMRKFHYALIDGSSMIYQIISMMFNEDGGLLISRNGYIVREWAWPSKGKLDDPVEISVNAFITVKISGRFAISLVYKWHPEILKLSLAPVKRKSTMLPLHSPETTFPDVSTISKEAKELFNAYKMRCKLLKFMTQDKYPSNFSDSVDITTFDTVMDISPMSDISTVIKLRRLQRKVKDILFNWLDYYRFSIGEECLHKFKVPKFPPKVIRKQAVSPAEFLLQPSAKGKDENKEYLLYRNTFLKLKGVFQPSPLPSIRKTQISKRSFRLPFPIESKIGPFASHLACPVVLRRMLCGKEWPICRCSTYSIPEVTDLEYDHLIKKQLSSMDQIIIVYVFSTKEKDKTMKEVNKVYREQNKTRNMPCVQSRLDSFRFLKYDITSASKFTGSSYPLLVQRHNVIPGNFLMYIQGKLLFANFIFNGYSTSAKDLHKQIVKTRHDYDMGYFLPSDFRIQ